MAVRTLLTRRDDLARTCWRTDALPAAGPGTVLVEVEHVALTANVFTYGALGDSLGYWRFWPTADPQWGCLPAWGVARVLAGDALPVGSRLAGLLPLASHAVLRPERVTASSLRDGAAHRRNLMAVYQHYDRLPDEPGPDEELASVLRPLVVLAALAADEVLQERPDTVVLTSASSRTGRAVARELAGHETTGHDGGHHLAGQVEVVGLTADDRVDDVRRTGLFTSVLGYDDLSPAAGAVLDPSGASTVVLVDLAGRAELRDRVRRALAPRPVRTLLVGATHGHGLQPQPGEDVFLAPDRMRLRAAQWGAAGLARYLQQAWQRHLHAARSPVRVLHASDRDAVEHAYEQVRLGRGPLERAHLLDLAAC